MGYLNFWVYNRKIFKKNWNWKKYKKKGFRKFWYYKIGFMNGDYVVLMKKNIRKNENKWK